MKKRLLGLALGALAVLLLIILSSCNNVTEKKTILFDDTLPLSEPDDNVHIRVKTSSEPSIVYAPLRSAAGYRYGPSIIYYPDGSCDAWFSCMGTQGEWDFISYRHSDNGFDFGDEIVVLRPNPLSMDFFSCCDPGVVYFNGYYYLGYTSTTFDGGVNNNVFVARSENPDGPYEKWNGSGWGGDPAPIIYYYEDESKYGAGEPSFVVVGDKLYIYYSWICQHGSFLGVAVADTSENWPLSIEDYGAVFNKKNCDSVDMMFLEDNSKFYGFCTSERFSENSGVTVIESSDGINFEIVDVVKDGTYQYLHNDGVAHRPDGHVQIKDNTFFAYAFSNGDEGNWGKWATAFQEIKIELYEGKIVRDDKNEKGIKCDDYFSEPLTDPKPIIISTTSRVFNFMQHYVGEAVHVVWYDSNLDVHAVDDINNVKFYGYDKSLMSMDSNNITIKGKVGETFVYFDYKGQTGFFKVRIFETGTTIPGDPKKEILSFTPVIDSFKLSLSSLHKYQIRGKVEFSDHTWAEAFNDGYMIDAKTYPVKFEVKDKSIITVSSKGIITPVSVGKTEVTVTIKNGPSFTVPVEVTDN
ncbi:MAG: Ig-like domain-containing protein [Clostridia bacterium]|nr:Ig-like domain-containing protein [Clostridia bacterium]